MNSSSNGADKQHSTIGKSDDGNVGSTNPAAMNNPSSSKPPTAKRVSRKRRHPSSTDQACPSSSSATKKCNGLQFPAWGQPDQTSTYFNYLGQLTQHWDFSKSYFPQMMPTTSSNKQAPANCGNQTNAFSSSGGYNVALREFLKSPDAGNGNPDGNLQPLTNVLQPLTNVGNHCAEKISPKQEMPETSYHSATLLTTPSLKFLEPNIAAFIAINKRSEVFCRVLGRLSVLSDNAKYDVSCREILRRIGAPECLNLSAVSSILRKAKNKENGECLQKELMAQGIHLPRGRRKKAEDTLFMPFVEGESARLASDFANALVDYFPSRLIVQEIQVENQNNENVLDEYNEIWEFFEKLTLFFDQYDLPLGTEHYNPIPNMTNIDENCMKAMADLSNATHGFAPRAIKSATNMFKSIVECIRDSMGQFMQNGTGQQPKVISWDQFPEVRMPESQFMQHHADESLQQCSSSSNSDVPPQQ